MSPKLLWGALGVLAIAVGLFHGWIKPGLDQREIGEIEGMLLQRVVWEGRYPPELELPLLDGGTFVLAEHVGQRVVALNFFATWCQPCREEMPELDRFHQQQRQEGGDFLLVGIDVGEERELVEAFVDELEITFPIALDQDSEVAGQLQVASYPTTVVIGLDGRVQLYEVGAISNAEIAFGELLARNREIRAAGETIDREAYLAALAAQPPLETEEEGESSGLEGRALEIAQAMPCPCGCDDLVEDCSCSTADKITARLATMDLAGRTDSEVMQELNQEFCVGAGG